MAKIILVDDAAFMRMMIKKACVNNCPHTVYNKEKSSSPIVVRPNDCVDHCHGCGNHCPVGAITYVGDDTGWTPPNGGSHKEDDCGCGCSGGGCCG